MENTSDMRTLGIDLGERRVGLALSDEGGKFATPLEVLQVHGAESAVDPIVSLIQREQVQRVVIGLPLNMDGTVGGGAKNAMRWGQKLAARVTAQIVYVDERLSSFVADQHLNERRRSGEKLTHQRKKERRDALAAASFLQAYLDGDLEAFDG